VREDIERASEPERGVDSAFTSSATANEDNADVVADDVAALPSHTFPSSAPPMSSFFDDPAEFGCIGWFAGRTSLARCPRGTGDL
jgi:hypothetical protein